MRDEMRFSNHEVIVKKLILFCLLFISTSLTAARAETCGPTQVTVKDDYGNDMCIDGSASQQTPQFGGPGAGYNPPSDSVPLSPAQQGCTWGAECRGNAKQVGGTTTQVICPDGFSSDWNSVSDTYTCVEDANSKTGGAEGDGTKKSSAANDSSDPCNQAADDTFSMCTASNAAAMAQQTAAMASIAQASTANAGAACSMQSKIAGVQALFSGGVAATCYAKITSCNSTCDPATAPNNYKARYTQNQSRCNSLKVNAAMGAAQAASQALASSMASKCADAYTNSSKTPTPTVLAQTCSGDPNYLATHTHECYCISHPGDATCLNPGLAQTPGGLATNLNTGGARPNLTGDPNHAGGGPGGSGFDTPKGVNPATDPGAGAGAGVGGYGGGAGGPATAAATGDAGAGGDAGGGSASGGNVFGGFSAGQGGFSYGSKGSAAGEGGIAGAVKSLANKFNITGLLPKRNDYISRAVAGMSVSAKDGITGPLGPSLWEKVSRRYEIKKGELLPP